MKMILIVVVVTMVALVGFGVASKAHSAITTSNTTSVASDNLISVAISGCINKPGTYKLTLGKSLIDLITAAGGVTTNADSLAYNPNHLLVAKDEYYIAPIYDNSNTCSTDPILKVNVNTASADSLQTIAGFSKSVSAAVVSYRATATFDTLEQIKEVKGCGQATYITVRDKITLRDYAD